MKKFLMIGAALLSTAAAAQEIDNKPGKPIDLITGPLNVTYPLMVTGENRAPVFTMGPTACLRGPMQFMDPKGAITFSLTEGVEYPTGCGSKK